MRGIRELFCGAPSESNHVVVLPTFVIHIAARHTGYIVRLGQTSAIHFGSQVITTVVGFVATLYIARKLGSATLGSYSLFIAVVIWAKVATGTGLQQALKKRISEREGSRGDLGAGLALQGIAYLIVAVLALALAEPLNEQLRFDGAGLLVIALALTLMSSFVSATLQGEQKVHIAAVLTPIDRVIRSGIQLAVVFFGVLGGGMVGLVWGYIAGGAVAALVGFVFVGMHPRRPSREHFERILGFARYSWLGDLESRSFSSMDTIVLGLFVSSSLIGYYEVAWNLASILAVFGVSISNSLFPTLSELSSANERDAIGNLIENGLAFAGLFIIPGLVGALVIGDQVLGIYSAEFQQASGVLILLIVARLLYAYEAQFTSALYAIDHPDTAFRINAAFIGANLILNCILVYVYGWIGAAVATTIAAGMGLVLGYRSLIGIVDFRPPIWEIVKQGSAASMMGIIVYVANPLISDIVSWQILATSILAGIGGGVYFVLLTLFSK